MFCTTAFAATGAQDGVSAELTTDKATYATGEVMNVTLVVKNGNVRVNNVRTELVIPAGVSLTTGALVSEGVDLAPNAEATYNYGLTVNEVETPTTTPSGGDNAPETGDISLMIYGVLAIASLTGLVVLMGGKNIFKQRWFALVLCGALLLGVIGPVAASAAATEKTFEVTETVTIAGTAAEVKAVITYDLNDDVVHTEEVSFKKDGQYLWNVDVEQGYYLPSDVTYDGKTTSKDGAYRPEVNAPYIDMLFGTTKKAGEFKTNIFNANAQQIVLMGLTDDAASKAALEMIDEDEWIIALIDGKLVVTGWYDNATAAAARALYALGSADAADITLNLPMIGKMNYVNVDLPAVTFGNFRGGMDSDFGAVILRWNEVVADDFDAYCAALEAAGYTMIESNTMAGFKNTKTLEFATYVKGDDAVLVQYLPVSLLDQDPATLNAVELKAYQAAYSADGDSIRLILTSADLLGNTAEENTGWTDLGITPKMHNVNLYNKQGDGNDIGQCEIFTLADGSYIVVDGGQGADAEQVYRTLSYMNERPDGKIVIAAWFLTHAHADHTGALGSLAVSEWASEITIEQIVLNNVAKSYRFRTEYDPYGYAAGFSAEFDNIKTVIAKFAQGENYQLVMPHMGQVMHIRNAEVEMLTVGDEDMFPVIFNNDNGQSLAFRVTFPGVTIDGADQSVMILGDSALDQTYNVYFPLMCGELYADIIQVSHHGLGGQTSRFYPMISGIDVSIFPTTWRTIDRHGLIYSSTNKGLQIENGGTTQLNIVCDEYVQTLHLPFDVKNDHVLRTKIGTYKTKFQDAEMEISMLPAFRFQMQWNKAEAQEKIVAYLKEYSADLMILPLIDQNSTSYNKADLVNALYEYLDYNYIYYAPVWDTSKDATGNFETGDNTMGHLVLSTYPILKAETKILVEGNTTAWANPEGRGYAHVLLDVEGVEMDVVATHFNDKGNWTKFAELYEQWGQYTIIAGNTKIKGDVTQTGGALASAAFDTDVTVLGTEGITFVDSKTDNRLATEGDAYFVNKNMSAIYTTKAVFSLYTAPEASTAPIRQAFVNWWVNSWGNNYADFQKVVKTLKDVNPAIAAFHMVNHEVIGMTEEQVKAELGYPYAIWVPNNANSAGKMSGHYLVSHYPIEDLGVLEVSNGSDDAADQYKERRAFGHALVTINGTEIDIWYGTVGPNAPKQVAKLEAAVNATATETGRPFIISTNDAGWKDVTSFAGYAVYNYWTSYETNVLVSKGKVTVTGTELVDSGVAWAGVDKMNVLDLDVQMAPSFVNWWANSWGGSFNNFEKIIENLKEQNAPIVALHQISNSTIGIENPEIVLKETGYKYGHYVEVHNFNPKTVGHFLLSNYPIEVMADFVVSDGSDDQYKEGRKFGHVVVDINGTKVDIWYGNIDGSAAQLAKIEAEVNRVAVESGRPFIFSSNDITSLKDVTSFAGYGVTSYYTSYISNVLISTGLTVTKTETIKTSISYPTLAGVDDMNVIHFETADGGLTPGDPFVPPVTPEPDPEPDPEPEVPAGETATLKIAQWWANYMNKAEVKEEVVAYLKNAGYDIVGLIHLPGDAFTDPAAFAAACGYEHYAWAFSDESVPRTDKVGHMILSKYPIASYETVTIVADDGAVDGVEGRSMVYAVVDVEGTKIDVFCGENAGGGASDEQRALMESLIKEKVDASGNDFVVFGYHYRGVSEYAGKPVTQYSTGNTILASGKLGLENGTKVTKDKVGPNTNGLPNIDPLFTADLIVTLPEVEEEVKIEKLNVISWWCSYKAGFNNGTNRQNAIAMLTAQNADILVLSNINLTEGAGTAEAEAAAYGFEYCEFVAFDSAADPNLGTLLMSKYPFTFVEEFTAGKNFKLVQYKFNGKTLDFFFGGDPDYDALAAKVKAVQETNKNAFIVALKGAPQTLAGKLTGLTDAEGKAVTMFSAFWGSSNGVLVSSPMTASEVAINPLTNGFATTNGMGDRAILAPVIFP